MLEDYGIDSANPFVKFQLDQIGYQIVEMEDREKIQFMKNLKEKTENIKKGKEKFDPLTSDKLRKNRKNKKIKFNNQNGSEKDKNFTICDFFLFDDEGLIDIWKNIEIEIVEI